jgi:lipid-A-disaccharide synthase
MRLLISAIEPSAELLAVELLNALKSREPGLEVEGLGGKLLQEAGMKPLAQAPEAVMGGIELLRHFSRIRANARVLKQAFSQRFNAFIAVDAPDFHLPLLEQAKKAGICSIAVVAPQVWAWRAGRARTMARKVDQLLCLFPFEPELFIPHGVDAHWIGHPVVDRPIPRNPEPGTLALFPGSRPAELASLLPDFLKAASGFRTILLAQAPGVQLPPLPSGVTLCSSQEAIRRCERALSKSGTITLELAQAGIPTVVAHRVHFLTWLLGKLLVRGVQHIALPNILLKQEVFPEFIQHFTPEQLKFALQRVPPPPTQALQALLGPPGVAGRAADLILEKLS